MLSEYELKKHIYTLFCVWVDFVMSRFFRCPNDTCSNNNTRINDKSHNLKTILEAFEKCKYMDEHLKLQ